MVIVLGGAVAWCVRINRYARGRLSKPRQGALLLGCLVRALNPHLKHAISRQLDRLLRHEHLAIEMSA